MTTTTTTTTKAKVSKAKMLRLGSSMGLAIPVALTRRVWKGAAYSSWSVGFELQHEMGQALLRNHHRFSLTDLCQLSADFAADPPANASSVRTIYCGGVRANMIQYRTPCRQPTTTNKPRVDDKAKANERDLSKSESSHPVRSASKVAYRTTRRRSLEGDADLSKSSPSPASTPSSSNPSSGNAASTRTKLSLRRVRTDTDNLGRDHHVNQETNDETLESTFDWEEEEEPAATVLYLHGGGFCVGSATTYRRCLWHFSREMKGLRFLAVDYSLSPHVRFPTALQECLHAYLWLIDENGGNVPPERVVLAGDSAGGCLVLALLFLLRQMRDEAKACADNDQQSSDDNNDNIKDDDNDGGLPKGKTEPPFALPSRKTPPAMPLCAFLLSPWVDLSEASSVMQRESYADASTYAAQMGLARRFIAAYLHGVNDPSTAAVDKKKKEKKKEKKKPKELKDMTGGRKRANTESAAETTTSTTAVPDVHSPFISPLYGDLHDLPPMMLTAGGEEPLLADIEALRAKCLDAGLEVEFDVGEHMNHAYQVFHEPSAHREIERSIQAVGRFVWRHIAQRQLRQSDD